MNEIKFDVARMKELLNRLEEIREQLGRSCHDSSHSMCDIYDNVKGEKILIVLKRYSEVVTEEVSKMFLELDKVRVYLQEQISKYVTTEQVAVNSLAEVKNLLSSIQN